MEDTVAAGKAAAAGDAGSGGRGCSRLVAGICRPGSSSLRSWVWHKRIPPKKYI